jgi:hypothetical protein
MSHCKKAENKENLQKLLFQLKKKVLTIFFVQNFSIYSDPNGQNKECKVKKFK